METQLPPSGHSHGHICYFPSCRWPACLQAQADSSQFGFKEDGSIAKPKEPVRLPWENQDAA